jgi:hypothetical protein
VAMARLALGDNRTVERGEQGGGAEMHVHLLELRMKGRDTRILARDRRVRSSPDVRMPNGPVALTTLPFVCPLLRKVELKVDAVNRLPLSREKSS